MKDIEEYKKNVAASINTNEKHIAEFKSRIANHKMEIKENYEQQIAKLDAQNSDLKKKIADFKSDAENTWVSFKNEFSSDMEALGKAFKNFTIKNEK